MPKEEHFIHKDAVPAISPRKILDKVQEIIKIKAPFFEKSYTYEIGMIYEDDYEEVSA